MRYLLSQLIESALTGDETHYFSVIGDDDVIHHRSEEATFSERINEVEKAKSFNEPILVHLIMLYFPNTSFDRITINKNKSDLINNWMKVITERFLKLHKIIKPSLACININDNFQKRIQNILINHHQYNPKKRLNWYEIGLLYQAFYTEWDRLFIRAKTKKVIPSKEDYYKIFETLEQEFLE